MKLGHFGMLPESAFRPLGGRLQTLEGGTSSQAGTIRPPTSGGSAKGSPGAIPPPTPPWMAQTGSGGMPLLRQIAQPGYVPPNGMAPPGMRPPMIAPQSVPAPVLQGATLDNRPSGYVGGPPTLGRSDTKQMLKRAMIGAMR